MFLLNSALSVVIFELCVLSQMSEEICESQSGIALGSDLKSQEKISFASSSFLYIYKLKKAR